MIKAQFKLVKEVILLTRSNLLANSIKDNLLDADFFYIYNDYQALINFHNKINLLIIDLSDLTLDNIWHHKIKTIVNLTSKNKFSQDEINISKPLRLNNFLKIIQGVNNSQDIFCIINNDFIYNEKLHTLSSQENSIRLTAKENNIFKSMLLSTDFRIEKEFLLKNVWKYHKNSESSTIDTHLYRLKAKLPDNMLELKSNSCQLKITSLD
ncbi:MAG: winged helix-turn-helix domain-containing protein [Rickettsiaceae bacterium]|nr:winged helix-turn-helix domain-containing protein [Rickettsiaceae bacterium]